MRIIHRYIASSFLTTFIMALLVLSFVMFVGLLFEATKYIARGMSFGVVLSFIWSGIPGTLSYSIPIAALVSSLLVFGRMSSDSEISAMRSCGISLTRIMRTPVLISLLLAVFCLYLNNDVAPESAYARSAGRKKLKVSDFTALIEIGKYVDIGGHSVYVGSRQDDVLFDLRITESLKNNATREIKAQKAIIFSTNNVPALDMYDVSIDPVQEGGTGIGNAKRIVYMIADYEKNASKPQPRLRRVKDMHSWELFKDIALAKIYNYPPTTEQGKKDLSRALVQVNSRLALALACFCLVAVGVPMGIKQHRRESSLGISISLAVACGFYLFCMTAESLAKHPDYHAHYIVWIPVIACLIISAIYTAKNN